MLVQPKRKKINTKGEKMYKHTRIDKGIKNRNRIGDEIKAFVALALLFLAFTPIATSAQVIDDFESVGSSLDNWSVSQHGCKYCTSVIYTAGDNPNSGLSFAKIDNYGSWDVASEYYVREIEIKRTISIPSNSKTLVYYVKYKENTKGPVLMGARLNGENILEITPTGSLTFSEWERKEVDITSLAGTDVVLTFFLHDDIGSLEEGPDHTGWIGIDNISIEGEPEQASRLVNITTNTEDVFIWISGINNSSESFGHTPLSLIVYSEEENITLVFSKYGYMTKIVKLDPNATSLFVELEPEPWRIMDFLEVGKITQEEQGFTLVYKGITYALEQNVSDGNPHIVSESDMKITSRSGRWELETSEGISMFSKIENASESQNVWYLTTEINNREKIKYSYSVFTDDSGENVTVLKEANMTFRFSGSSNGESNAGVLGESGVSEFFISITYDFVNNTRVFMETSETARAKFSQPLVDWMNETRVPGMNISLTKSMMMMEFIPLEGTAVSAAGKAGAKIPVFAADGNKIWKLIYGKLYEDAGLTFKMEKDGVEAGKAIITKQASADWGPIFKKIDANREANGLTVIREAKPIAEDETVFLLPYEKGTFWNYFIGKKNADGLEDIKIYVEECKKNCKKK